MSEAKKIGERIFSVRGGASQAAFAAKLGVHRKTVERWESGERMPDGESLLALKREYNVDISWLLLGEGNAPALDARQSVLLANYNSADDAGKRHIETTAMLLTQPQMPRGQVTQNIQGHVGGSVVAGDLTIGTPLTSRRKK